MRWTIIIALSLACGTDPKYLLPPGELETPGDPMATDVIAMLTLPYRPESMEEQSDRQARATSLGIGADVLSYPTLGALALELDWVITNPNDTAAQARVMINGANAFFAYDPLAFVVDPEEDAPAPSLLATPPVAVAANGSSRGTFREDEFWEAAIDLNLITRTDKSPYAAILENNEDVGSMTLASGEIIPRAEFSGWVRLDVTLQSDAVLVLTYTVRARDHGDPDYLHELLLAAPQGELATFNPAAYVPPPPVIP